MTFIHGNLKDVLLNIQAALVRKMKVNASWKYHKNSLHDLCISKHLLPTFNNNWKKDWCNMTVSKMMTEYVRIPSKCSYCSSPVRVHEYYTTTVHYMFFIKEHQISGRHYRLECLPKPVHHCVGSAQQSSSGLLCASNTAADWIKHKNSE